MAHNWYKVADKDVELVKPTLLVSRRVNDKQLCIGRNQNGYFAVSNTCPHAGGSLGDGWCDKAGNVVCPLHRYMFNPENGQSADGRGFYVEPYLVDEREDGIYVGFPRKKLFGLF